MSTPSLFDSHCHLDFPEFDSDRDDVLQSCWENGMTDICIPGTEAQYWPRLLNLVENQKTQIKLHPALGLHPYFLKSHQKTNIDELRNLLQQHRDKICAIGEIGLDYAVEGSCREEQYWYFTRQLEVAQEYNLPVILHARQSHDQVLKLLRQFKLKRGGIVHAYSGSEQQAHQYIELGFKLGMGGTITYDRAKKARQIASKMPLDALVLETDAPDMPLSGFQGQRNSPLQAIKVAQVLADLRQISASEIVSTTYRNAIELLA